MTCGVTPHSDAGSSMVKAVERLPVILRVFPGFRVVAQHDERVRNRGARENMPNYENRIEANQTGFMNVANPKKVVRV